MQNQIITAIEKHLLLKFNYDGLPREVQPYILGKLSTGNFALSAYQVAGQSHSEVPDWKTFSLAKIQNFIVTPTTFKPISSYNPDDPKFPQIIAKVS